MLIIFDLDDTLIETSKCLTPIYLEKAYEAMVPVGLNRNLYSLNELIGINLKSLSSKLTLQEFCKRAHLSNEALNEGLKALISPLPSDITIDLVPGAAEILGILKKEHTLALVTAGDETLQLQKMKKAGIQQELFSKLIVSKGSNKMVEYQKILSELDVNPELGVVCGDRVSADLTPAKELGLFTVHFKNGRGLYHDFPQSSVDLTIKTLHELCEVFCKNEN